MSLRSVFEIGREIPLPVSRGGVALCAGRSSSLLRNGPVSSSSIFLFSHLRTAEMAARLRATSRGKLDFTQV